MFGLKTYNIITEDGRDFSGSGLEAISVPFRDAVPTRSLIFCLCENSIGSIIGYLGCLQNDAIAVMLDASKGNETFSELLETYKPNFIWAPTSKRIVDGEPIVEIEGYGLYGYSDKKIEMHPDLALLLTTSGSTGSPKLVRLTKQNLLSNAESIAEYLHITAEEHPITTLPMHYSFGLSVINSHLLKGATILLTDKALMQKEFWTFLQEHKATSLSGVPYTFEMLRRLRFFRMKLPYLRTLTQAGGKLNAKIVEEFVNGCEATGKKFYVMYGQTEATARMSYLPPEKAAEKCASIGIAIPGGKLSVIDADGNEITEPNVDGELVYTGPNVSMGYAESQADLALGDENHDCLHTGDIARFDEDGFFYITGRMKRFVKVWGNRCNLDAVEQIVKAVTPECACVGVDDKITVFITKDGIEEEIKQLLSEKTGLHIRAFSVRLIDELPKNSSGKLQYKELELMLNES